MPTWIWILIVILAYLIGRLGVRQRGAFPALALCAVSLMGEELFLELQEAVDEAFKDLVLYGTSTLRITSTPDTK